MAELLITQIASDQAEVLLVGKGALAQVVLEVTQAAGLGVLLCEPELGAVKVALQAQTEWYKVIWVVDATQSQQDLDGLKSLFKQKKNQLVIVVSALTSVVSSQLEWRVWSSVSTQQQQLISNLIEEFNRSKLIVVKDWLGQTSLFELVSQWFFARTQPTILDPQTSLTCIETKALHTALSSVLFRPQAATKVVIEGAAFSSKQLVSQLATHYHHLHGEQLATKVMPVTALEMSEEFTVLSSAGHADVSSLVKQVVRHWPSPNQMSTTASSKNTELPTPSVAKTAQSRLNRMPKSVSSTTPPLTRQSKLIVPPTLPPAVFPSRTTPPATQTKITPITSSTATTASVSPEATRAASTKASSEAELEQTVASLFTQYRTSHRHTQTEKMVKSTRKLTTKTRRRKRVFLSGLVGSGLVITAVLAVTIYIGGGWLVSHALDKVLITQNQGTLHSLVLSPLITLLHWQGLVLSYVMPPGFGQEAAVITQVARGAQLLTPRMSSWKMQQVSQLSAMLNPDSPATVSFTPAGDVYQELSQQQAALKELVPEHFSEENQAALREYQSWLEGQRQTLSAYQQLQPWLGTFLGQTQKRTYAVVLQNEQELRPTGGFIQAVALVSFDKSKVVDVQVMSSYELDSKLTGVVKPPEELTKYLGEQRWFLRDSNWDPNFPTTAAQIAWFIERSSGKKIDGVLGLTVGGWQQLIKATGPVDLPEFNEIITDRNLSERLEFHSEIQFAEVSDKPDYTAVLMRSFWTQLQKAPSEKIALMAPVLLDSLKNQQAVVSMVAPDENQVLTDLGWSGSLITPDCPSRLATEHCVVDSIAQVAANVGVNKANYYITEKTNHAVKLTPEAIEHQRTTTLTNTAKTNAWPKGVYKVLLRWYVPTESQLTSISVDGTPLPAAAITTKEEHGKTVWSALVDVPIQAEHSVELSYTRPLPYSSDFSYALFNQKQPGTHADTTTLSVLYDPSFKPTLVAPQATLTTGKIEFSALPDTHQIVGVSFK